jgi:hypothetical protein
MWQEQLFQRRRAVEQRERIRIEALRQKQIEVEEERRQTLDEWDRERNVLLLGEREPGGPQDNRANAVPGIGVASQGIAEPISGAGTPGADPRSIPDLSQMPTPADIGVVLVALMVGCGLGFVVMPAGFSLFGAGFAGAASLVLRARRKSRG